MPLRGSGHSPYVLDDHPYFESLAELDNWTSSTPSKLRGILQYTPRRDADGLSSAQRGRLLVCHDYKGGYTESPSGLSYTFNFWAQCDTFIYFSHHRISCPPSGWTNAAHRQGVKILGTLIFENSGEQDCLKLLVGHLPHSKTGPVHTPSDPSFPVSPHYASVLAELAFQRGFDGYLLNFECPLRGGPEQTRALSAWIMMLEHELKKRVGEHAQTIWYDSVIVNGGLRWQDRLNSLNLPFFMASSAFFTNYTWPYNYPSLTAQYFLSIDPLYLAHPIPKYLQDIFVGVDVWGRGSHGGGGFGCYKAISHIDPEFLGLSVALFGQAWTWESEQDKSGWTWDAWWAYERKLWVGPEEPGDVVRIPEPPTGQPNCPHGSFVPMSSFFPRKPPPNPIDLPFYTSFSPGVGRAWFVYGVKVLQTQHGWTDVDKSTSLGDMVWPRPMINWENREQEEDLPRGSSSLCMDHAWMGGSSLRLSFSGPGSDAEDAFFRCLWVPIQSLSISSQKTYTMTVVLRNESDDTLDLDLGLSVQALSGDQRSEQYTFEIIPEGQDSGSDLPDGWKKFSADFCLAGEHPSDILSALGLVIGFAMEDPTQSFEFSILLGSISVYPSLPYTATTVPQPQLLWADFQATVHSDITAGLLSGTLTWQTAASFPTMRGISIESPEDPVPAWSLHVAMPSFLYFNIYIQPHLLNEGFPSPDIAHFIGTTGLQGRRNTFYVDPVCIPTELEGADTVRFLIQGVTDRGEILPWERCVFVDVVIAKGND